MVSWHGRLGPVLRNDMDTVGPNYRSRLVVQGIKKPWRNPMSPLQRMPLLESVEARFSLCVSHYQEEAKGKRTLAMYDISRAHFRGIPVRRVFVELPDEESERLARENGLDIEDTGLLRKCMHATVEASAR